MKAPYLILILFLFCMTIVLVALDLVSLHNQRGNTQAMERVIADLTERAGKLENELTTLREREARREAEAASQRAEAELASVKTAATNHAKAKPVQPQPFQARAYVGNDYLGMAWVIPSNVKPHPETGEYRFEPVIWIDERNRKAFTQTNVVEREVVRNTSTTQVYQQPYWYGYPVWIRPQPETPGQPNQPPAQRPPTLPSPGLPRKHISFPIISDDLPPQPRPSNRNVPAPTPGSR